MDDKPEVRRELVGDNSALRIEVSRVGRSQMILLTQECGDGADQATDVIAVPLRYVRELVKALTVVAFVELEG